MNSNFEVGDIVSSTLNVGPRWVIVQAKQNGRKEMSYLCRSLNKIKDEHWCCKPEILVLKGKMMLEDISRKKLFEF